MNVCGAHTNPTWVDEVLGTTFMRRERTAAAAAASDSKTPVGALLPRKGGDVRSQFPSLPHPQFHLHKGAAASRQAGTDQQNEFSKINGISNGDDRC